MHRRNKSMSTKKQKKMRFFSLIGAVGLAVALVSAVGALAITHSEKGTAQQTANGVAKSWATLGAHNDVRKVGVTVPLSLIASPPSEPGKGPAGSIVVLQFPEVVQDHTLFNHFELHWEAHGHEPDVFLVPHFDLHFYAVPESQVRMVVPPDPVAPDKNRIPDGFIYPGPGETVPQMGVHAVRPADLQMEFTDVLIFGFYDGKMTFIEPMVTQKTLLQKKDFELKIPVPETLGHSTLYPTMFKAHYVRSTDSFRFEFSDFVMVN
jgi:hypothetical protein